MADSNLWSLIQQPDIDAGALASGVSEQLKIRDLDDRTRLLVRRSLESLRGVWSPDEFEKWLSRCPARQRAEAILAEPFDEVGFPSLQKRVSVATRPETVQQYLRELATLVSQPTQLVIGGSIAGILAGHLHRHTEDIHITDEVPQSIRRHRERLDDLAARYGLHLTHFQSHYLPRGWNDRLNWYNDFGALKVYYVDPYDLFVGKLFSRRDRDRDDLRMLIQTLEKSKITRRLQDAAGLLSDATRRETAAQNWYIIYGERLPGEEPSPKENSQ